MFCSEGEYYCINGCFCYPVNMNAIINFLNELQGISNLDEITCYDIQPGLFSYESAMNDEYQIIKGNISSLSAKTLLRMDFYYFDVSCQLQVEYFDDSYYGLTLIHNNDDKISEEFDWLLKETFYRILKPIYGNDGHEKGAFSLNQLKKMDCDLFNNNFYISNDINQKIGKRFNSIKGAKIIKDCGIYYLKGDKAISELLFYAFLKIIHG